MSSKITKRMISRVDEMISRASSATQQQTELGTKKQRKTARRALLGALSSKRSFKTSTTTVAGKSDRAKTARRKARSNGPRRSLLEDAKSELRGKSKAARNVSLLTYSRQQRSDGVGAKSQRAVEQLLLRDQAANK